MKRIKDLLASLNIKSNNVQLYAEAMTHNSYSNERRVHYNYQRLEFLGDVIISKIISTYLFFQGLSEGEMTEFRKMLVNAETLVRASEELHLIDYAFVGNGLDLQHGTRKIKEDLFESLMGAIYLDKGEIEVYNILKKTLLKYFKGNQLQDVIDYKSKIQEIFQSKVTTVKNSKTPYYVTKEDVNNKGFTSTLFVGEVALGVGYGNTKKEAEKSAAKLAYEKFVNPNKQSKQH